MADTNPFEVLGVSPSAEIKVIKSAFRALAKKYHPDSSPGSATRVGDVRLKQILWAMKELESDLPGWRERVQDLSSSPQEPSERSRFSRRPETTPPVSSMDSRVEQTARQAPWPRGRQGFLWGFAAPVVALVAALGVDAAFTLGVLFSASDEAAIREFASDFGRAFNDFTAEVSYARDESRHWQKTDANGGQSR